MGHGIPAALVASMVKLAFSVQAAHAGDPARVLASMNQILCGQLDRSYVTAVYVVVDTEQQSPPRTRGIRPCSFSGAATT
jgi:serine phosphatase RsbU (regulator of sigma subunit)